MSRKDSEIEIADLEIRLYTVYSETLEEIYAEAVEASKELKEFRNLNTTSVIVLQKDRNIYDRKDDRLTNLIAKEQRCWRKYHERANFIKHMRPILHALPEEDYELLRIHYFQKYPLRKIGELYNYSHMQISRKIDSILRKL